MSKQSGALVPEGRQQASDSGHFPFRGPPGDAHRARICSYVLLNMPGADPALIYRHLHRDYCAGFNRSRCVILAPNPTWKSVSLTHIRCRMLASLRATAVIAHNMLDRWAIRRPHARRADHFLTRSSRLAAASQSASRTATSPCLLMRPSKSIDVPDWCRLGVIPKWAPTVRDRAMRWGSSTPPLNDRAATGPTPGTVIKRRQTGSCWTTCNSTRCSRS